MRVWLINNGEEIPSDPGRPRLLRTAILSELMARRGHDVVWWNATVNHQRKVQRATETTVTDTPEGYKLVLLYGALYRKNISPQRVVSLVQNAREFTKWAPTLPKPDAIMVGMPSLELAAAAVSFAKANGIPIAVDFRDMWPDVIEEQLTGVKRLVAEPALAVWRRMLRTMVRDATAIVGVTDGFVDWALEKAGRQRGPLDRAFHLAINPEAPPATEITAAEAMWDGLGVETPSDLLTVVFAGTLSRRLDIGTLVQGALDLDAERKKKLRVIVCGRGDLEDSLRRQAGDDPTVRVLGWRTASEINVLLKRANVGALPYLSSPDFVRHYPNKVGEYFSAGLPIMTPLIGQVRQLLESRKIGFFYREQDAASCSACLAAMIDRKAELEGMRGRAVATFDELFEPVKIYADMCNFLETLPRLAPSGA